MLFNKAHRITQDIYESSVFITVFNTTTYTFPFSDTSYFSSHNFTCGLLPSYYELSGKPYSEYRKYDTVFKLLI